MTQNLNPLKQITEALYTTKLAEMQKIRAQEAEIRYALATLDSELAEETRASQNDMALRSLGADILWQGWVGRKRASLQMRLAQVLVQKEKSLKEMRKAFGKKDVVERLVSVQIEEDKAEKLRRSF